VNTQHSFPSKKKWRDSTALIDWLKGLAEYHLAVTITFGNGRHSIATSPSKRVVEEILRKGLKRLNTLCYRNLIKRKGYSIGAVAVIEGTGPFERIHVHIAFERPPGMSFEQFSLLVCQAFRPSKWIEQRPHITECWSQDWINYILKLGQEALVPSCCFTPKHPGA
jgi:hypothetical protein